jgi:hypothetical protein
VRLVGTSGTDYDVHRWGMPPDGAAAGLPSGGILGWFGSHLRTLTGVPEWATTLERAPRALPHCAGVGLDASTDHDGWVPLTNAGNASAESTREVVLHRVGQAEDLHSNSTRPTMLCRALLCYAMPCHAMPCYAMLCGRA